MFDFVPKISTKNLFKLLQKLQKNYPAVKKNLALKIVQISAFFLVNLQNQ